MIVLKEKGERGYVPVIQCDFCGKPITGPNAGLVGWPLEPLPSDESDATRKTFYFAHRNTCDQTLDAAEGGTMWMDIEDFAAAIFQTLRPRADD